MTLSVDELRDNVTKLRSEGLNTQQIADELSLSQTTIEWLSASQSEGGERPPADVRIGWRTIGVRPMRIDSVGMIFADVVVEELDDEVDTIVGISLNGILFANSIAEHLDLEVAIHRSVSEEVGGQLSNKYGNVGGKQVVIVDDVLSTGVTMRKAIESMREQGAEVKLCMVLVNKTTNDEVSGVPLRGLIRAVQV